jgi:hypothetical protein
MSRQRPRRRTTVLGFAVAVVLLAAFLVVVGVEDVVGALLAADPVVGVLLAPVVLCWIAVWSGSLRVVLGVFDVSAPLVRTYLAYGSMMFWDNVTPVSTVAADPLAAGVISRAYAVSYERSLAVVVTVDFLNFSPSPFVALFGLLYVSVTASTNGAFERLAVPLVVVLAAMSAATVVAWRYRRGLVVSVAAVVAPAVRAIRRVVPVGGSGDATDVRRRLDDLLANLETVAARRRALVAVLALATAGWTLLAFCLWLSLYAVGVTLSPAVALLAVPLVTVVELVPLPGGVGGLEPLLVLLLVATSGGSSAAVTAGVLVFRTGTHWFPVVFGGASLPYLLSRSEPPV